MEKLTALSLSIALLSGLATFLAVGPLSGLFLIWAATIAWAAYFFLGADKAALKSVITCGTFGVFMAWLAAIQITNIPADAILGSTLMTSITVAVTVLVMCLAASVPQLSCIPASVLGYSSTFAYLLQTPEQLNKAVLFDLSLSNPLLLVPISIVVGTYFGQYSAKFAAKLTRSE